MNGSKGLMSLIIVILTASALFLRAETSEGSGTAARSQISGEKTGSVETLESVQAMLRDGRYAEAEASARKLLAEVEARTGTDSLETARVLDVLVECFWRKGNAADPEARKLAERVVAIKEKVLGPEHLEVVKSLQNHAALLRMMAHYAGARPLYQRALDITEKKLRADHLDVAQPLYNLACLLVDMGHFSEARPLFDRALHVAEKALGPDHLKVALILNAYANLLVMTGQYSQAKADFERVLAIREKAFGPRHHEVASSLNNLGLLLRDMGDFAGARRSCERALAIREEAFGLEHPLVAQTLHNLAGLLIDMGDYREARAFLERALAIRETALGDQHPEVADTLKFLGTLYEATGDYARARTFHEHALAIREKTLGSENYDVAISLDSLANLLRASGEPAGAESLCERGLAIREKILGTGHPEVAESLRNLARLKEGTKTPEGAAPLYVRALAIQERVLGPEHPALAATLTDYARLLAKTGEEEKAFDLALRAEEISRNHIRLTARTLSERQALHYASVRANALDLVLYVAAQDMPTRPEAPRRAWDSLIRSRALVLDEMAARHRASNPGSDPKVARLAQEFAEARERLAHLVVRGAPRELAEGYRDQLDQARKQAEQAERALAERSVLFRRTLEEQRAGLREVTESLPSRSAIVAFVRYDHTSPGASRPAYLAFLLAPGEERPRVVPIGPASDLEGLVSRWHEEAARGASAASPGENRAEVDYRIAGATLRRIVWDPLVLHLRGAGRVFIVPDGALNLVNFAALPLDDSGYLVETGPLIHYLSAERDLAYFATMSPQGNGLLAVGDPAFDDASSFAALALFGGNRQPEQAGGSNGGGTFRGQRSGCGSFQTLRFEPLPASASEVKDVVRLWERRRTAASQRNPIPAGPGLRAGSDATLLEGPAASEAAFKEMAPGRRVLHLATHGFFLFGVCPSALKPLRGIGGLAPAPEHEVQSFDEENPLLLSGLALGGANLRAKAGPEEEDGILTAEEIAAMHLTGVEWAVLSGCDTGLGEIKAGEGVLGLRRAFQIAGVRTVIMSLWPVGDEPAREWMRELYAARFLSHLGTAEAVHQASLAELRRLRGRGSSTHPSSWAGFVAAGDWR